MLAAIVATAVAFVPQGPLQVEITPKDKVVVAATWTPVPLALDTEFGSATVKPERLEQIAFGEPDVVIAAGVEDRMIAAAVPEFELDGIGSDRPRQQLMPQADAEVGQSLVEE